MGGKYQKYIFNQIIKNTMAKKINLSLGDINEVEADKYARQYVERIEGAQTESELIALVNKIYNDGYEDGANNFEESEKMGWGLKK